MSIQDQIVALEAERDNTKGPGSKAKKVDIQAKIDALKAEIDAIPPKETPPPPPPKKEETDKEKSLVPKAPVIPEGWIPVTQQKLKDFEKQGVLIGYDPKNGVALIKS